MSIAKNVYSSIKFDRSKVRKLSFYCCCECCSVFLHLSSGIGYDGILRLSEAEDPVLPAFGEEAAAGLDIKRHQLLPNDLGGEQRKATGMGNQE